MKRIALVIAALVIYFVLNTLNKAGVFKRTTNHFDGTVVEIYENMPGPEDLDLDMESGLLFIASSDRWALQNGEAGEDGIYILQLDSGVVPQKLPTTYPGSFHPHGISYLKNDNGAWLFAVNHNNQGSFVEVFGFRNDSLIHLRSLQDALMCCPNDVVAVSPDKFYVTNDHGTHEGFFRTLEEYLQLPLSYLLYYDGASFTKAYTGLKYANGVNDSQDGKELYLTHTTGRELLTFNRNKETGEINLISATKLHMGVDNITVDSEGNVWIAGHPKLLAFTAHAADPDKKSASQVLKLSPEAPGEYRIEEIYMDDGFQLSGSSVALKFKNELFIGVVFESKLMRVEIK